MPQSFTVHCLVLANFHPEASEQRLHIILHNKVKISSNLHFRLPAENHYLHLYRYAKGHTGFFSLVQTETLLQMGHRVTEINLSHFLVHVGCLLLFSTGEEQKLEAAISCSAI